MAEQAMDFQIILVSTGMADSSSRFGYTKMKGQLEDEVKSIGFKRTIILQPGLLMGSRYVLQLAFIYVSQAQSLRQERATCTREEFTTFLWRFADCRDSNHVFRY